jgi:hypothetical protein
MPTHKLSHESLMLGFAVLSGQGICVVMKLAFASQTPRW